MARSNFKIILLWATGLIGVVWVMLTKKTPQDPNFHDFVDVTSIYGIPNFNDVISNIPFLVFGVMGFKLAYNLRRNLPALMNDKEINLWLVFFGGLAATGITSAYYHLNPDHMSLVPDRLTMTICFAGFFAIIIAEYISINAAYRLVGPFIMIGAASVSYWIYSELIGEGDLRPYILVKFLPVLLIIIITMFFDSKYAKTPRHIYAVLGWFMLASLSEYFDKQIYNITFEIISGHTLKHVLASMAGYRMIKYLKLRCAR